MIKIFKPVSNQLEPPLKEVEYIYLKDFIINESLNACSEKIAKER